MKKALIVVDMLNDFILPDGKLFCGDTALAIVEPIMNRVKEYNEAGLPVMFLADTHTKHDLEFERFPEHCVVGTKGADIIDCLVEPGMSFITKSRYSGFYNTALDDVLSGYKLHPGLSVIEVCGVCTSICVMDTIGGLANRDFATVVHRNCVADFDQEMHKMALKRMANLYGTVII